MSREIRRRHLVGAVLGIALEVYDFTTFSYFAIAIGKTFFPSGSAFLSLMMSLGVVGAGFLSRPFGAYIIGRHADRIGRTPAMMLSFTLMGLAILLLCLTPGYERIGVTAPVLVLLARLLQGFALGGEVGSTTAFLLEAAPEDRRGLYCALQDCGQGLAAVVAGAVGAALASVLDQHALESYGWRIAMLLGAAILPVGLILRRTMPETLVLASEAQVTEARPAPAVRRIFITGLAIIGSGAALTQIFRYMTTYSIATLHLSAAASLGVQGISGICLMVFALLGGALSDRVGRRAVMIGGEALYLLSTVPVFYLLAHYPSTVSLFGGVAVLAIFGALSGGATIVALMETLPARLRSTVYALSYAVALAIFGSTTQPFVTWLIHVTADPMMLGWCAFAASAVGLAAKFSLSESAPGRLSVARRPPQESAISLAALSDE